MKKAKVVKAWGLKKWNKQKKEYILLPFARRTQNQVVISAETNPIGVYKIVRVEIREVSK